MKPFHFVSLTSRSATSLCFLAGICLLTLAAQAGAAVIATGTFQSKEVGIAAAGNFEIEETGGKFMLVIKADFQVSEGPDLFFVFNPLAAAQVTEANAKTNALKIDPELKSLKGAQTYPLPDDFDLAKYASLIVHCWKYNHLYAAATVKPSAVTVLSPGKAAPAAAMEKAALWRGNGKALISASDRKRYDLSGRNLPVRTGVR
ncbi:MAG: DM13 domain-containing protein [Fibrobacterota bacterium]|nr:DM13 domain-containing protein [Fibrobacterota bacterium]